MLRPHERPIAVVIDLDALGSPDQIHRELRRHHKIDGALKGLRPAGNRPKRSLLPVERANARAHFAAAHGPRSRSRRNIVVHSPLAYPAEWSRPKPFRLAKQPGSRRAVAFDKHG